MNEPENRSSAGSADLLKRADDVINALLQWTSNWTVPFQDEDEWLADKDVARSLRRDIDAALTDDDAQPMPEIILVALERARNYVYPDDDCPGLLEDLDEAIAIVAAQPPAAPVCSHPKARFWMERDGDTWLICPDCHSKWVKEPASSLTRPERATASAPDASTPAQRPRE